MKCAFFLFILLVIPSCLSAQDRTNNRSRLYSKTESADYVERAERLKVKFHKTMDTLFQRELDKILEVVEEMNDDIEEDLKKIGETRKKKDKVEKIVLKITTKLKRINELNDTINKTLEGLDLLSKRLVNSSSGKHLADKYKFNILEEEFENYFSLLRKELNKFPWLAFRYYLVSKNTNIRFFSEFWGRYINSLNNNIDSLNKLINDLKDSIETENVALAFLKGEFGELSIEVGAKNNETKLLHEDISILRKSIIEANVELDKINVQSDSISNANNLLLEKLKTVNSELANLRTEKRAEKRALKDSIASFEVVKDTLEGKKRRLEKEIKNLEDQVNGYYRPMIRRKNILNIVIAIAASLALFFLYLLYLEKRKVEKANTKLEAQKEFLEISNRDLNITKEKLQEKTEELNGFIKELHHRIKNNLQIVVGLLAPQTKKITDSAALEAIDNTLKRIEVMGLIHKKLYENNNPGALLVNFASFMENLLKDIVRTNKKNDQEIKLSFNLGKILLHMDKAIDLGLIVNELISNCFKHAFPRTENPELRVDLFTKETTNIVIKDNGPGLPSDFSLDQASFGLKFVQRYIIKKRKWQMEFISTDNGVTFSITVP